MELSILLILYDNFLPVQKRGKGLKEGKKESKESKQAKN